MAQTGKLVLLATFALLASCRLIVEVPEGGSVESRTGNNDCSADTTCVIDVENGTAFSDTFVAVPDPGYSFSGWLEAAGHLCGGSLSPCAVEGVSGAFTSLDIDLSLVPRFVRDDEPDQPPGEEPPDDPSGPSPEAITVTYTLTDPVHGASVAVMDASTGAVLCELTTGGASDMSPGAVTVPGDCLSGGDIWTLVFSGGESGGAVLGNAHLVVSAQQSGVPAVFASALSEALFPAVSLLLESGITADGIRPTLNSLASRLLKGDITGDGVLDLDDLAAWNPAEHLDSLAIDASVLLAIEEGIRNGTDTSLVLRDVLAGIADTLGSETFATAARQMAFVDDLLLSIGSRFTPRNFVTNPVIRLQKTDGSNDFRFPVEVGTPQLTFTYGLTVVGDIGYVQHSVSPSLLAAVDLSNPLGPRVLNADLYRMRGFPAEEFWVFEDLAFAANSQYDSASRQYSGTLEMIDMSDPLSPAFLGSFDVPGEIKSMVLAHDYLYAAVRNCCTAGRLSSEILVYELDRERNLLRQRHQVSTVSVPDMVTDGEYLYVADGTGVLSNPQFAKRVRIFDLSTAPQVVETGSLYTGLEVSDISAGMVVDGDRLYLAHGNLGPVGGDGIGAIDVANPSAPRYVGNLEVDRLSTFTVREGIAYVGTFDGDITRYDMSRVGAGGDAFASAQQPFVKGRMTTVGDLVYTMGDRNEWLVFDIEDEASPEPLEPAATQFRNGEDLVHRDGYLYIKSFSWLMTVDVSTPAFPQLIDSGAGCTDPGSLILLGELALDGNYLYSLGDFRNEDCVTWSRTTVQMVVHNLAGTVPSYVGSVDTGARLAGRLAKSGDQVFVAARGDGVKVIDVSDPASPRIFRTVLPSESFFALGRGSMDVAISGDALVIAQDASGLFFVDIERLQLASSDAIKGSLALPKPVFRVVADDSLVYAAARDQVYVLDMRGSPDPVLRAIINTRFEIYDLVLSDNALLISTSQEILSYPRPESGSNPLGLNGLPVE